MFVLRVVLVGVLFMGCLLGLVGFFGKGENLVLPPGIARATLADGSVLTVLAVTTGTHGLELPGVRKPGFWNRFFRVPPVKINRSGGAVLWLSRNNPKTGQPLTLDDWLYSRIIDGHGWAQNDQNPYRMIYNATGNSSYGGRRPFPPDSSHNKDLAHIVYSSEIPFSRGKAGMCQLEIYNVANERMAIVDIPEILPLSLPTATPEAIPQTHATGDIAVTLDAVNLEGPVDESWRPKPREDSEPKYRLNSQISLRVAGQLVPDARVSTGPLVDSLGNQGWTWGCTLSPHNSPWSLTSRARIPPASPPEPGMSWTSPAITLPGKDLVEFLKQASPPLNGGTLTLQYQLVSGPGKVRYPYQSSEGNSSRGGWSHHGSTSNGRPFKILLQRHTPPYHVEVEMEFPHLRVNSQGMNGDLELEMSARDQEGRDIPCHFAKVDQEHFFFLQVDPASTAVIPTLQIVRYRSDKFSFVPPPIPAPPAAASPAPAATSPAPQP